MSGFNTGVLVRCFAVTGSLRSTGVRCFAQVTIDQTIFIDGLSVRVTSAGKVVVTWPERKDGRGQHHAIVRIFDPEIREAVERAVLTEAVRGGWLEPCRVRSDSPELSRKVAR